MYTHVCTNAIQYTSMLCNNAIQSNTLEIYVLDWIA